MQIKVDDVRRNAQGIGRDGIEGLRNLGIEGLGFSTKISAGSAKRG